jgi:hypothetical protein
MNRVLMLILYMMVIILCISLFNMSRQLTHVNSKLIKLEQANYKIVNSLLTVANNEIAMLHSVKECENIAHKIRYFINSNRPHNDPDINKPVNTYAYGGGN